MAPRPPAPELAAEWIRSLQTALHAWFLQAARALPWRETRDPYRIWLSEAMLQQTRVDTVVPYYEKFLAQFPTLRALADADESAVLQQWSGLGYYSRARNLKRAAERVVREHGGELPRSADALRALPGVGPYTVGAIRSIAFRERAPLVDGNVSRVLARLTARAELTPAQVWALAEAIVPEARPDVFNQALMELGATVCTPRAPACSRCPVTQLCAARQTGTPEAYPAPRRRAKPRSVHALGAVIERGTRPRRLLALQRPARGLLGGLWEIPSAETQDPGELVAEVQDVTGLRVQPRGELGAVRHLFSHRDLRLRLWRCELAPTSSARAGLATSRARWCTAEELDELPSSRLMHKIREEIAASRHRLV